jgi:hypothetical protein
MLAPALAAAITVLFTVAGIAGVIVIADSLIKARRAYDQLMHEAALMQAGFAVQVEARELRMRRAPVRVTPLRRSQALRMQAVPAYVAA